MRERKDLKRSGKKVLKKHYLIFILVCAVAAFIGSEFSSTLTVTTISSELPTSKFEMEELTSNNYDELKAVAQEKEKVLKSSNSKMFGRSRGVFSSIINSIDSGNIYISLVQAINSVINSTSITICLLILLSLFITFLVWYFIVNTYQVISRRIFLEGRIYEGIPKQRFLFLFRIKKWHKASFTMFVTSFFHTMWTLTIVGGVIKYYSYYLVPYIVAENPDMKATDAITLSRKMMNGHKFECFKLQFSFIGWEILGVITLGLSKLFYSNSYKLATISEYYTDLRNLAITNKINNFEKLNDKYLFEKASREILEKEYSDILETIKNEKKKVEKPHGIKAFIGNTFGITLSTTKKEKNYEEFETKKLKIKTYKAALEGKVYPSRLFKLKEKQKRKHIETVNYLRKYSIFSIILLFFIFSFIGWTWEVCLHLISDGVFVNRGVLHGPWLPIYGSGGVLILVLLYKFRKNPALLFALIVLLCGVVEYSTSYYLEVVHNGQKWWDYSGYFLNLNGRICAEGLLVFGLGGMAIVYIVAPVIDNYLQKVNTKLLALISIVLISSFFVDQIYSKKNPNTGKGITDYAVNTVYRRENINT